MSTTITLTRDGTATLEVTDEGYVNVRHGLNRAFAWAPFHTPHVAAYIREAAGRPEYVARYRPEQWNARARRPLTAEALAMLVRLETAEGSETPLAQAVLGSACS